MMLASVLTVDLGNTHTDLAVWQNEEIVKTSKIKTNELLTFLADALPSWQTDLSLTNMVFCSVVPEIDSSLRSCVEGCGIACHQLTNCNFPIPIAYPNPSEIGQDRLANALGAWENYGKDAVVIDFGTATNFDVLRKDFGYEGGILTPGLATMTDYLHEKTALLPRISLDGLSTEALIGKSTYEAMQIGAFQGYLGMIERLLSRLTKDHFKDVEPVYILTGGAAQEFSNSLTVQASLDPQITMKGLYGFFKGCS